MEQSIAPLETLGGRRITAIGVKPIKQVQLQFEATYFSGIVEPQTGEFFCYEFRHKRRRSTVVSQHFKDDLLIINLDHGGFHKAKRFPLPWKIPIVVQTTSKTLLLFLGEDSPQNYSPESNPQIANFAILTAIADARFRCPKTWSSCANCCRRS